VRAAPARRRSTRHASHTRRTWPRQRAKLQVSRVTTAKQFRSPAVNCSDTAWRHSAARSGPAASRGRGCSGRPPVCASLAAIGAAASWDSWLRRNAWASSARRWDRAAGGLRVGVGGPSVIDEEHGRAQKPGWPRDDSTVVDLDDRSMGVHRHPQLFPLDGHGQEPTSLDAATRGLRASAPSGHAGLGLYANGAGRHHCRLELWRRAVNSPDQHGDGGLPVSEHAVDRVLVTRMLRSSSTCT
jgi:hypothetical protein